MRWRWVAVAGAMVGFALSGCAPAAPPSDPQIEQPIVASPDTPATVVPSGSPSGPPSAVTVPPEFGWDITTENVGLRSTGLTCDDLAEYSGPSDVPAGTTILEKRVTSPLNVSAGGITIERSCIQPTRVDHGMPVVATTNYDTMEPAAGDVTIRDSEFDGSLLSTQDSAMVTAFVGVGDLSNNLVHHFGSGIALMVTGVHHDVLVELNYVTDLVAWGDGAKDGNHSDAFTLRDFETTANEERTATIRNNRFDCDSGNDTGALFIQTYAGRIGNVVIEGNLLEGGGYQLGLNETNYPYSAMSAVNNRFSGTGYGPAYVQGGSGWDVWQDNHLFDPDQAATRGATVRQP